MASINNNFLLRFPIIVFPKKNFVIMSKNRDMLKEAIADAKSVKEVAIANAKLALEEAFTPHLKSMMSAKLEEMDKEDDKVDEMYGKKYEEDDVKTEEMDSKDKKDKKMEEMAYSKKDEVDEEINLDELLAELDEEVSDADQKAIDREVDAVRDDLDQISKLAKDAGEDAEDIKDRIDEDARTDAEEEGYLDGMKDEKEDMDDDMDDMEVDLDDLSEDDLKGYIESVIKDMVEAGELEPGDEFEEEDVEVEDVEDVEVEDDVDVDVEIDEAKEEVEERMSNPVQRKGDDEKKDGKFKKESKPEMETEKMRKMEEDLKSAIDSINELKGELNEVNLLNAKLLYTNKIFKSKNLTESKKVKVLKAFDKAKDVKQAKTIFETLNEGIIDNSPITESKIKGSASKITGKAPVSKKQPIVESDAMVARFKKLAGII